ncbi:hypothetical protein EA462_04105 [Natrarchaeobius halalkaliphilus]|uniref:Uncharacterized protein n=1 Tax=Natrarchaeobius halalkaliphilus TaxID=1679091 RepID=A0A3N6MZY6_9EURY|nr:hypothetical protein [Natrarchaeobius halalkaliphilus]RQG91182.1 hypothetical protein EA462_04105 [Natrarchaeobius halalkaliphilus]
MTDPTGSRVEITRRPTLVASGGAIAAVALATVIVALTSTTAGALALVGLVSLLAGVGAEQPFNRDLVVDLGSLAAFAGVIVAGLEGSSIELTLLATVCVVVAWDLAGSAVDLGRQLGREADTRRLEIVQTVSSLLIGLTTVTIGYGVYAVAASGQPVGALVLLLLAGTFATLALGTRR